MNYLSHNNCNFFTIHADKVGWTYAWLFLLHYSHRQSWLDICMTVSPSQFTQAELVGHMPDCFSFTIHADRVGWTYAWLFLLHYSRRQSWLDICITVSPSQFTQAKLAGHMHDCFSFTIYADRVGWWHMHDCFSFTIHADRVGWTYAWLFLLHNSRRQSWLDICMTVSPSLFTQTELAGHMYDCFSFTIHAGRVGWTYAWLFLLHNSRRQNWLDICMTVSPSQFTQTELAGHMHDCFSFTIHAGRVGWTYAWLFLLHNSRRQSWLDICMTVSPSQSTQTELAGHMHDCFSFTIHAGRVGWTYAWLFLLHYSRRQSWLDICMTVSPSRFTQAELAGHMHDCFSFTIHAGKVGWTYA